LIRQLLGIFVGVLPLWIIPAASVAQVPQITWEKTHPNPTGQWLFAATWGAPGFVAAGWGSEALFSEDTTEWEANPLENSPYIAAACYYQGRYILAGDGGVICTSTNGRTWTRENTGTSSSLRACAGGGGYFAAAGWDNTLIISANGVDWEQRPAPASFVGIAFGNDRWVAVSGNTVYWSTNLTDWTSSPQGLPIFGPVLNTVCFGDGRFVMGGALGPDQVHSYYRSALASSEDGIDWEYAVLDNDSFGEIQSCTFSSGTFVAVQGRNVLRSTNGVLWERLAEIGAIHNLRSVTGSPESGWLAAGERGELLHSADGKLWSQRSSPAREYFVSVVHADHRFVVVGGDPSYIGEPPGTSAILTSTDGSHWNPGLTNFNHPLFDAAYGNGTWVASGEDGTFFTSTDGTNWTDRSISGVSHDLTRIAFGNGRFVARAVSRDLVYVSTNSVDWSPVESPGASELHHLRFVNGVFAGGGTNGHVLLSTNGVDWTVRQAPTDSWIGPVAYGKGRYVAGGYQVVVVSTNGIQWQAAPVPMNVRDIAYSGGWFYAVGYPARRMLVSRDGLSWQETDAASDPWNQTESLAVADDLFVEIRGTDLLKGSPSNLPGLQSRVFRLSTGEIDFTGSPGIEHRLEESVDLQKWNPASEWIAGRGESLLWNTAPATNRAGFWRIARRAETGQADPPMKPIADGK
jgi:hypothetical protein